MQDSCYPIVARKSLNVNSVLNQLFDFKKHCKVMTKKLLYDKMEIISDSSYCLKKKKSLGVYVFFQGKNGYQGKKRKSLEYKWDEFVQMIT